MPHPGFKEQCHTLAGESRGLNILSQPNQHKLDILSQPKQTQLNILSQPNQPQLNILSQPKQPQLHFLSQPNQPQFDILSQHTIRILPPPDKDFDQETYLCFAGFFAKIKKVSPQKNNDNDLKIQ